MALLNLCPTNWGWPSKFQQEWPRVKSPGKNLIERENVSFVSHYAVVRYPKVGTFLIQAKPSQAKPNIYPEIPSRVDCNAYGQIYATLRCGRIVDGTLDLDLVSIMITVFCAVNAG